MKKLLSAILISLILLGGLVAGISPKVEASTLKPYSTVGGGVYTNGWYYVNGQWYYYTNGTMQKGWLLYGGVWYYLDPNTGAMYADEPLVDYNGHNYRFDSTGAMITGWYKNPFDQGWYWFNPYHNQSYYKSSLPEGAMYMGWLYYGGYWYYLETCFCGDGQYRMVANKTDWINGQPYYFDANGHWIQ